MSFTWSSEINAKVLTTTLNIFKIYEINRNKTTPLKENLSKNIM